MTIYNLGLDIRTTLVLKRAGITTLEQLKTITCTELMAIDGFGRKSFYNLVNSLMNISE